MLKARLWALKKRTLKRTKSEVLRSFLERQLSKGISKTPFYQAAPYTGALSLWVLDSQTIVDPELKVTYPLISKSGNSSLAASLHELKTGQQLPASQALYRQIRSKLLRPSFLDQHQAAEAMSFLRFSLVRDPFTRILSSYLSKVVPRWHKRKLAKVSDLALRDTVPTFEEFCVFLADGGHLADPHWTPQVEFHLWPLHTYDSILKIETIGAGFSHLARRIGASGDFTLKVPDPKHATGASEQLRSYYTPACVEIVRRVYREDFEAFGYSLRLPDAS